MGNHLHSSSSFNNNKSLTAGISTQYSNQANVQFCQEYDNPKRQILSSNFLSGINCSANDLQSIHSKQFITSQKASTRRFSLIKIDSIDIDKLQPNTDFEDDVIKQSWFIKKQKRSTISHPIDFDQLKKKTLFRQTKNYIVSAKHLYQPLQIKPQKFIGVKKMDIEKFYQFIGKIGEGSYGNVMKALCLRTNQFRAIKILKKQPQKRKDKRNPQKGLQQLNILRRIDHPNIMKLFEVYFYNDSYYLVTEYCGGGSILDYLRENKSYSQNIVKTIIKQLLSALAYLHSQKVAHRDIKLQNIVFIKKINSQSKNQDVQIKIIDFGQALQLQFSHNNKDARQIGTLTYMAPEVLQGLYSQKCDIWSCGIILWILLSGRSPFKRNSKRQTIICIKNQQVAFRDDFWDDIPQNVKVLLNRMLQKNPLRRISAKQALKNNWFSQKSESINGQKMKQVVKKLYNYYRGNNLISVIQSYLSFLKITQQQRTQITKLFKRLDKDNSGSIDINELKQAFALCTQEQDNNQIEYVLRKIDKNRSKKIDLNEFITAFYDRKKLFHENSLQLAFDYFDNDENGYIDKKELKNVLKGCDQQQINKILHDIDQNGDEKISKQQFIRYIKEQRFL